MERIGYILRRGNTGESGSDNNKNDENVKLGNCRGEVGVLTVPLELGKVYTHQ